MEEGVVEKRPKQELNVMEHHFLQNLPSADMYERSYMHKDIVTHSRFHFSS